MFELQQKVLKKIFGNCVFQGNNCYNFTRLLANSSNMLHCKGSEDYSRPSDLMSFRKFTFHTKAFEKSLLTENETYNFALALVFS